MFYVLEMTQAARSAKASEGNAVSCPGTEVVYVSHRGRGERQRPRFRTDRADLRGARADRVPLVRMG